MDLIALRVLAERERAAERAARPRQLLLPFGDGLYDDETPQFHGTNVGLARHADKGERLCQLCQGLMDELLAADLAVRLDVQEAT